MDDHLGSETDQILIQRAQEGDRQAFGTLVFRYQEKVIRVVYRMCGDLALAEDAAQEAFIRAWQRLPKYQHRDVFSAWLYRIAINQALDVLRREQDTVDVTGIDLAATNTGPEEYVTQRERTAQVRQAIMALPPASRAALILREYEALSYQEIAEVLEIPLGTVMSRLSYARTRLRELLTSQTEIG